MFQPGTLVVYGATGVCRVEAIQQPEPHGTAQGKTCYLLKPLYQDGVIYTPVENTKVPIRPVMTRKEADALISLIPTMRAETCRAPTVQALTQHYQAVIHSGDRRDLIRLMMSIYAKQQQAEAQKRRLGMVDERYMKQAERLLYGELAAALEIPFDQVQPYIARRVEEISSSHT